MFRLRVSIWARRPLRWAVCRPLPMPGAQQADLLRFRPQASTLTPGDAPQAVPAEAAEALLLQAHCLLEAAPFGTTRLTDAEAGRASRAAFLVC